MPKVLKITSVQYLCNIWRKNRVIIKLMFCMLINMKVDSIIFNWASQVCPKYLGKSDMSLWHLNNEVRNEIKDLTALADSNTTLKISSTSNVLAPLNFFSTQYGINITPFLHLINCFCNISSLLLFQMTAYRYSYVQQSYKSIVLLSASRVVLCVVSIVLIAYFRCF